MTDQRPQLRPLEFGEVIDAAFRIYTGNFAKLTIIAALVLLPLGVISALIVNSVGFGDLLLTPESQIDVDVALDFVSRTLVAALATWVLSFVATSLIEASSIQVYADTYMGRERTWQESMVAGLALVVPVVTATFLIGLASAVGLIFCIVPGVWLWTSWFVTVPAIMTERRGVIDSMTRSWRLVRPRFWQTLGIIVVVFLIVLILQAALSGLLRLVTTPLLVDIADAATPEALNQYVGYTTMLDTIGNIFTLPFLAAVATVVYFDLRVRSEGFDIEQLVQTFDDTDTSGIRPVPPSDPDDPFGLRPPPNE